MNIVLPIAAAGVFVAAAFNPLVAVFLVALAFVYVLVFCMVKTSARADEIVRLRRDS